PAPVPWNMIAAMALAALLNTGIGLFPGTLYALLPFGMEYEPYTYGHVTKAAQLLAFAFLAFWIYRAKLGGEARIALDTDWVYRRPARLSYVLGPQAVAAAFGMVERAASAMVGWIVRTGRDPVGWLGNVLRTGDRPPFSAPRGSGPDGGETASTALRLTVAAGALLVLSVLLAVFLGIVT
ncbi:MAG TPA: hypothetical protein VLH75_03990, partial [Longimicrobiales bacterium]|nr:hypothetical protein [Longimicrobiales bacterium]